jgi:hypothetical protein
MKRLLYFFPYFLTNMWANIFFINWCFLAKDTYFNPALNSVFYRSSWLFVILLLFSMPRFLIKGAIPEPFKKGLKEGFQFIGKIALVWGIGFFAFSLWFSSERFLAMYEVGMWYGFFFTIYTHYRWKKFIKKHTEPSK